MSRKGVVRHIDVVRRQDITNIFLCKQIQKVHNIQKYTDIIQAEEKQKKKRTKTKTTSLDTLP